MMAIPQTTARASPSSQRIDRLPTLQHFHERTNLFCPAFFGLHVVNAKREGIAIVRVELLEHPTRLGFRVDRGEEIIGQLHLLAALISSRPTAVGLCSVYVRETEFGHLAFLDQTGNILNIDLAPHALFPSRRVAL